MANQRTVLHQSHLFEIVSIEWTQDTSTDLHEHGWSECSVLVEDGTFENTHHLGFKTEVRLLETGQVIHTPVGANHWLKCLTPRGKTLHVYTPRITAHLENRKFDSSLPESLKNELHLDEPVRADSLQNTLNAIRDHSISTRSPYFMNQLYSGVSPQMLMAEDLIAKTKTTLATQEASPVFSVIENEVIKELGKKIGWAESVVDGVTVPGGSAANFMAIHCARQRAFPEAKKKGLRGERVKLFVSSESHYSFQKAALALGLGTENVVSVPVDARGRMRGDELNRLIELSITQGETPFFVGATAGTTVLGAFDPLDEIAAICQTHRVWFHVDGAWGGPALFTSKLSASIQGAVKADSFTFDAHKFFGAGMTCAFLLTRHPDLLLEANDVSGGDYLFHPVDSEIDRGRASWQCGRRADAVSFWTIWKSLGSKGLSKAVERLLSVRDEAVTWVKQQPRLTLICEPEYLNLCVRITPPTHEGDAREWSKFVREQLKRQNLAMVNYSENSDGTFLRLILTHPELEVSQVKQILAYALEVR